MMTINYCQKCGQVMECVIIYQCGLPRIKYFCPHHGTAIEYQVMYSTSTNPVKNKINEQMTFINDNTINNQNS